MTDNTNPIEDSGVSTSPDTGAVAFENTANPDAIFNDVFGDMFDLAAEESPTEPDEEPEDEVEEPEVSEDDSTSEGDSDTDDSEADEEVEETEADTSIVDWDEMKDFSYEIGGKTYSANDLKAALGRQSKQEESRKEVEEARKEIDERRQALAAQEQVSAQRSDLVTHQANLTAFGSHIAGLQKQQEDARASGDSDAWNKLQMEIQPLISQYQAGADQLENLQKENQNSNLQVQRKLLVEKGRGEILSDKQRRETLGAFLSESVDPATYNLVTANADLLILAEEARLYRKAQASAKKGKLKGNGKTLKGGASKSKPVKKKSVDSIQAQIDEMFKD